MGCLKLANYEPKTPLKVVYRSSFASKKSVQRFFSVDPWQYKYPSTSVYDYCFSNPIKFIDPSGKGPDDYLLTNSGDLKLILQTQDKEHRFFNEKKELIYGHKKEGEVTRYEENARGFVNTIIDGPQGAENVDLKKAMSAEKNEDVVNDMQDRASEVGFDFKPYEQMKQQGAKFDKESVVGFVGSFLNPTPSSLKDLSIVSKVGAMIINKLSGLSIVRHYTDSQSPVPAKVQYDQVRRDFNRWVNWNVN